ncbi:MAG: hypothetical protein WCH34_10820 [Bacteroidota bacterium]
MTKLLKLGISIIIIVLSLNSKFIFAQFINIGGGYYNTSGTILGIGIGSNTSINSTFQIDGNTVNTPTGEVFRTYGPSTNLNAWRLLTGTTTPAEMGMIFNYGNNSVVADRTNYSLQASTSDMTFHTLPLDVNTVGTKRMRIVGVTTRWVNSSNYVTREGNIGIGTASVFKTRKAKPEIADGGNAFAFIGVYFK